jgi:hypothetical protein
MSVEETYEGVMDHESASEIGSSIDMGDIDTTLDGWLLKGGQAGSPQADAPQTGFSPKLLSEKQDPKIARLCYDHAADLLLEKEEIEYIVTVDPQEASNRHACAVATNKRVFIYNRRDRGDIDVRQPEVCFWQDMDDIYFEEEPEVSLRLMGANGWQVELRDVYPPQARRLYIYGVDHSERVLRNRVEQHLATHAGSPYVSEPLDEKKLEQALMNERDKATGAPGATTATALPIVPRKPRAETNLPEQQSLASEPAMHPVASQPQPALIDPQAGEPRPAPGTAAPNSPANAQPRSGTGSVLSHVMRAVQAADAPMGGPGPFANPSNPQLSGQLQGPASSPLSGQLPPLTDTSSFMQNAVRMGQAPEGGFAQDAMSSRLAEPYASGPISAPAGQQPVFDNPTGRLAYGYDGSTGPMPRHPYDPNAMSGPLVQPQPMPQVMPYLHPSQQPYAPAPYPQPDPQAPYAQPPYGYAPAPYPYPYPQPQPQYGQPYGHQYAPYGQQPAPYPPQPQPYGQPQPVNYAPQVQAQPQAPVEDADDIVVRLQKLKQMLDAGLITEGDYKAKKIQLLEEM